MKIDLRTILKQTQQMKRFFLIPLLLIFVFSCSKKDDIVPEDPIYVGVEVAPEFPGGEVELRRFLGNNVRYPSSAIQAGVKGRVTAQFVIEKDGAIGNIKILEGIGYGCDEEVVRVIKLMPKWIPGRMEGKAVRVFFTLPIVFA